MENLHDHGDRLPSTHVTSNRVSLSQLCVCACVRARTRASACVCSSCLSVHCRVLTKEGNTNQLCICSFRVSSLACVHACACLSGAVTELGQITVTDADRLVLDPDQTRLCRKFRSCRRHAGKKLLNGNVAGEGHRQSQRQAVREQGDGSHLQKWHTLISCSTA